MFIISLPMSSIFQPVFSYVDKHIQQSCVLGRAAHVMDTLGRAGPWPGPLHGLSKDPDAIWNPKQKYSVASNGLCSVVTNPPANAEDMGSIPGSGRSPGGGNGNPLQYSCLGNPWTGEPSRLQSMGSQRVRHKWVTQQQHLVSSTESSLPVVLML